MWLHGPWGWFPRMWIFPVFPLLFLVFLLIFVFRGAAGGSMCGGFRMHKREGSAREILDQRYARGELSQEDYQRMKKDLES